MNMINGEHYGILQKGNTPPDKSSHVYRNTLLILYQDYLEHHFIRILFHSSEIYCNVVLSNTFWSDQIQVNYAVRGLNLTWVRNKTSGSWTEHCLLVTLKTTGPSGTFITILVTCMNICEPVHDHYPRSLDVHVHVLPKACSALS